MLTEKSILYQSETSKVISVGDPKGHPCCVTFFTYASDESSLANVDGFAENALAKADVPSVHFINLKNHWWQTDDLDDCLAAAVPVLAQASRLIGYGASMGGYAALRFAGALGLNDVLAFSPQFSIDPERVPFENRWPRYARRLDFSKESMQLSMTARHHIVYDPRNDFDARHVSLIKQMNQDADVTLYPIAAGDHFVIREFHAARLLPLLIKGIGKGFVDGAVIRSHPEYRGVNHRSNM